MLAQAIFKSLDPKKGSGTVPVADLAAALKQQPQTLEIFNLNGGSANGLLERLEAKASDGEINWSAFKTLMIGAGLSRQPSFAKAQ